MMIELGRRYLARFIVLALAVQFLAIGANTVRWHVIDPWGITRATWRSICGGTR